jgi:hypothetical protein
MMSVAGWLRVERDRMKVLVRCSAPDGGEPLTQAMWPADLKKRRATSRPLGGTRGKPGTRQPIPERARLSTAATLRPAVLTRPQGRPAAGQPDAGRSVASVLVVSPPYEGWRRSGCKCPFARRGSLQRCRSELHVCNACLENGPQVRVTVSRCAWHSPCNTWLA